MIRILFLLGTIQTQLTIWAMPSQKTQTHHETIPVLINGMWPSGHEAVQICDIEMNYNGKDVYTGPKLFIEVDSNLFDEAHQHKDFAAFRDSFYRTRNEVRGAKYELNDENEFDKLRIWNLRKEIFKKFVQGITSTGVFVKFRENLQNEGLLPSNDKEIIDKLTELWVPEDDEAGFDYNFMGNVKVDEDGKIVEYGGLHNWVGYYLHEKDNLIHYKGIEDIDGRELYVLDNMKFDYIDVLSNQHYAKNEVPSLSTKQSKEAHSMLLRTTPAFDFCLYTTVALAKKEKNDVEFGQEDKGKEPADKIYKKTSHIKIQGCHVDIVVNMRRKDGIDYIHDAFPKLPKNIEDTCKVENMNYLMSQTRICRPKTSQSNY